MENKIDELNIQIKKIEQENEIIKNQLEPLIEKYKDMSESKNLLVQKKKEELFKKIYDLKRKQLYNKMKVFNLRERIEYMLVKGKEMPNNFHNVKFTNDNYQNIDTDTSKQTTIKPAKHILNGLFRSEFFSMQKTIDTESAKLDDKVVNFNNYVSAIKKIFNDNIYNIKDFFKHKYILTNNKKATSLCYRKIHR